MKNYFLLIVVLFFIACFAAAAAYYTVDQGTDFYFISKNPGKTTGTLTEIIHGYASEDSTRTYEITYRVDDKPHSTLTSLYYYSSEEEREIGKTYEIIYAVDDPNRAKINTFSEYYWPVMLAPACLILILIVFFMALRRKDWLLAQKFSDEWI
jgi:hypothetical protein